MRAGARQVAFVFCISGKEAVPPDVQVFESNDQSLLIEVPQGRRRDVAVVGGFAGSQSCESA
jgi:hypothetical protein